MFPVYGLPEGAKVHAGAERIIPWSQGIRCLLLAGQIKGDGGCQFVAPMGMQGADEAHFAYTLGLADGFEWVKGGKLPGFYGGTVYSGGQSPDGTNGFSVRLMLGPGGEWEAYAYLPTSEQYGTVMPCAGYLEAGKTQRIEIQTRLNTPNVPDGEIRVWRNGALALEETGLLFRTTADLKIDGCLWSVFYGGSTPDWAPSQDSYIDFSRIRTARGYIG